MTTAKRLTVYLAALAISIVAWILNASQLYWMAGALFLLPQVTGLFARLEHYGLDVEREAPHTGHQGEAVEVRLRVRNRLLIPKLQLSVSDELPSGLSALEGEPVPVHLPPHGEDTAAYTLQLRRRGVYALSGVRVHNTDLLGLSGRYSTVPYRSQIVVYPRVAPLPGRALPPERGGGHAPLEISRRKGEGSSFFGIREYRPGDPLRHVHWRTAARLSRLAVVEWETEEATDVLLAIETRPDGERDLGPGTTLDLAAGLAASLAAEVLGEGNSLRLVAPGATEWRSMAERGTESLPRILEILARLKGAPEPSLAGEIRRVAPHLAPGTLICWLTAVPDEQLLEAARALRVANLRPVVYALIDTATGQPGAWDGAAAELESLQIPVIRLYRDDELVTQLLA
jgi:uncharacterized protein (DUF58 family)